MTSVDFHFNAPDKVNYTCRLLRKAVGRGAKLVVMGEPALLRELDAALWTLSPTDFIAHGLMGTSPEAVLIASPVVLAESARGVPHHEVLVNLGAAVPEGFERFERLIEIVTVSDEDRQVGRRRYRHYADRGYAIKTHDQAAKGVA
ncbi:MAG TPA: DNA polymerase III subunit chi [Ramlibacter sp.]|nr:DNA polymerase III subunit chi [Ramlibacter sp.]